MNKPFDHSYFIGYVNQVFPDFIKVHFPSSVLLNKFIYSGEEFNAGLVGNYVTIEGENHGFLGRVLEVSLPEKERIGLNENAFKNKEFHPTGRIEILLSFNYFNPDKIEKGYSSYPNIGSKVFVCSSDFIQKYFKKFGVKEELDVLPTLDLGTLTIDYNTKVEVSQQAMFGRHCAIVGTTGGGKSWTVTKCIEEVVNNEGKVILFDPTGEYSSLDGQQKIESSAIVGVNTFFHYSNLSIEDLIVLLKPGGQVQAPKLVDAIKSLKIVRILRANADNNNIKSLPNGSFEIKIAEGQYELINIVDNTVKKEDSLHKPYNRIYKQYINEIESLDADFDITYLANQIARECVNEVDWNDHSKWGRKNDNHINNCVSLMLRANSFIASKDVENIFGIRRKKNDLNELRKRIDAFLESDNCVLRIGFEKVGYDFQIREILANAIGKYLLTKARNDVFKANPTILFIDEAHQYLNKNVKDEHFQLTGLNSIDQIAKECRKYGLFLCLATQMPKDIPVGTLSQMGTFVVHRLINYYDKDAIENACASANKSILSFLPTLGEGEGILMGVDFPMPIVLKVTAPKIKPDSKTPQFKKKTKVEESIKDLKKHPKRI